MEIWELNGKSKTILLRRKKKFFRSTLDVIDCFTSYCYVFNCFFNVLFDIRGDGEA
jgi:hypothetical protein